MSSVCSTWKDLSLTQCRLVKDYDIAFVSTGDVLRKEIMAKSEVGKRAEEVVASGGTSSWLAKKIQ